MELTVEHMPDGVVRLALAGRLDTAGTQAIDQPLLDAVSHAPSRVVIDLSQVTFLASIGIRTILSGAKALSMRGGRMALAGPKPLVRDVLALAGIHVLLPIYDDVERACEGLKPATEPVV